MITIASYIVFVPIHVRCSICSSETGARPSGTRHIYYVPYRSAESSRGGVEGASATPTVTDASPTLVRCFEGVAHTFSSLVLMHKAVKYCRCVPCEQFCALFEIKVIEICIYNRLCVICSWRFSNFQNV